MTKDELIELAAPSCEECGLPIVRTEMPHKLGDDGVWRPVATMICPDGHRMNITP